MVPGSSRRVRVVTSEDYVETLRWFRDNYAEFVPADRVTSFPAHWLLLDGGYFDLATIEACADFEAVQTLVNGQVGVAS